MIRFKLSFAIGRVPIRRPKLKTAKGMHTYELPTGRFDVCCHNPYPASPRRSNDASMWCAIEDLVPLDVVVKLRKPDASE